ncbi:methionine ABC transporter permease [Holzapfeliella floricola]|uniref:D-methionine transport system permease protein MetI n=1 Tax=Holzapfeliella floricola DSM 23037 = JCM 16512 TaxID=1423744 RepID=A0A0R2DJ78_9LACO|nr:methionine ABC transporter permease [Holzapfeliella floricola]KRN04105.1 D-methionine transport system permease protein MetI [Holzapfeliella floricola DSM 23037 = JCM 16512]
MDFLKQYIPNVFDNWHGDYGFEGAISQTLYMTIISAIIAGVIGLAVGLILVITEDGAIAENKTIYNITDKIVNVLRSIPFIILLALIGPLTKIIVGTTIGPQGALVPLVIGTFPFYARQVQNALVQVDKGVIEAAQSMGESNFGIVCSVYLKEGLPDLIRASTLTIISLVNLTAMAGAVGAGGLGSLALDIGYKRFQNDVTIVATLMVLLFVFVVQFIGDYITKKVSH